MNHVQIGQDIIKRVFDESFLTEKILAKLLHDYRNASLDEVAIELQKLEEGVYTTAQTPAGLVRAMKVK